jgi:anaerobic selenocysteine-containing dehydrogenase
MTGRLATLLGLDRSHEPVGHAFDERFGMIAANRVPDEWIKTTCGYCSVGCGMLVGVKGGKAVGVRGDPEHPVNEGRLCPKGLSEHLTLAADGRLTVPMVNGEATSWDRALDHVIDRFQEVTDEHGAGAVAILSTGQLVTEEFYALGKLARLGLGIANYDGNTTLCMASAVSGYKMTFGSDGPPGAYRDFETADVIVLVGANIADNHPLLAPRVLENKNATVIVIDPRVTKTAMVADLHLPVKPRTDIVLLNGIMKVMVDEDLVDREYIAAHTEGFTELVAHLEPYTPEYVSETCGIAVGLFLRTARAIGNANAALIAWTMGVNHSVQGAETSAVINTLCAITGNIGRSGASPLSITGQCNAMGTRETGFTASMPGYRNFDDPVARADLARRWGIEESRLPTARGLAYPDIIEAILSGKIKALWIIGTNPVVSFPNRELLELALGKLELLVVQDGFETPTTALAHVTLPAAIWGEKDGTFTNSERRVSRVRKLVEPPGDARSDFDIFLDIADRIGMRDELFSGWKRPEDAFEEWTRISAGRLCDYSGISYERIDAAGGVQWPCTTETEALAGTERLYADGHFPTPSGRARLQRSTAKPIYLGNRKNFPLNLNTGRTVEHWHTRTKTGRVPILNRLAPNGWVEMNPADASDLHLRSGEMVKVKSERGQIDRIPLRVTSTVRAGEIFIPFHFDEMCANRLTASEFDPISREPNYKQCDVRVEPADHGTRSQRGRV